jgi:hypothetical protein
MTLSVMFQIPHLVHIFIYFGAQKHTMRPPSGHFWTKCDDAERASAAQLAVFNRFVENLQGKIDVGMLIAKNNGA